MNCRKSGKIFKRSLRFIRHMISKLWIRLWSYRSVQYFITRWRRLSWRRKPAVGAVLCPSIPSNQIFNRIHYSVKIFSHLKVSKSKKNMIPNQNQSTFHFYDQILWGCHFKWSISLNPWSLRFNCNHCQVLSDKKIQRVNKSRSFSVFSSI